MNCSHRGYREIGILLSFLVCTQPGDGGVGFTISAAPPQQYVTSQPRIPMLDEGKGLIHLDVSVADANAEFVPGLNREDFELLDDGRPQRILSFHALDGVSSWLHPPVQIILFVDTFEMRSAQTAQVELSIERFLRQNDGHLAQPVSIFGFSGEGLWTIAHHDSTDGNLLASDVSPKRRIVFNHRHDALRAFGLVVAGQRRKLGRKVLLWIGPGCGIGTGKLPSPGGRSVARLIYWFITLLREARLSIDELSVGQAAPCGSEYDQYRVELQTPRDANGRVLYKKALAVQSGGNVVNDSYDLVAEMNRCARKASNFYTLSFDPPIAHEPHEYHYLKIRVDKPGVSARTNASYYDEPFYSDQPNLSLQRITVDQLGLILSQAGIRDSIDWEEKLTDIELTERLGLGNLASWTREFHAAGVQHALTRIADASSFLPPPPAEIPRQAAPKASEEEHMLALTRDYLEKSIPKLPNFYATRMTTRYEDTAQLNEDWTKVDYHPLRILETEKANVFFRAGDEVVELKNGQQRTRSDQVLITYGTFGPILADLRRPVETPGRMKWVRWEKGPEGIRAVFGFDIPAAESGDFEGGCCLPDAEGENSFRIQAGYHGEIAIDPATAPFFACNCSSI